MDAHVDPSTFGILSTDSEPVDKLVNIAFPRAPKLQVVHAPLHVTDV